MCSQNTTIQPEFNEMVPQNANFVVNYYGWVSWYHYFYGEHALTLGEWSIGIPKT
jgi:hypothetical protein